jgi:hypothetical protein
VVAVDASQNESAASEPAVASGETDDDVVFFDSFAGGSLGRWDDVDGLTIERANVGADQTVWMARARGGLHPAFARLNLPQVVTSAAASGFHLGVRFFVVEQGDNPLTILRLRTPDGDSMLGATILANRTLSLYNDLLGDGMQSTTTVSKGEWHELVVRVGGTPQSPTIEVVLDGTTVPELSGPIDLSGHSAGAVQIGDSTVNRVFDIRFAQVSISNPSSADHAEFTPLVTPKVTPMGSGDSGHPVRWISRSGPVPW